MIASLALEFAIYIYRREELHMITNTNVYNHLSTTLVPKKRNVSHNSSDLKAVYTSMAKYNKSSPLFLLKLSESKQSFIINAKEAALTLKYAGDAFRANDDTLYNKKLFFTENRETVSGNLTSSELGDLPDNISLEIESLAGEQINTGNYMRADDFYPFPGKYSFSAHTLSGTAELSVDISPGDTNLNVQKKVAAVINENVPGVNASIITSGNDSALMTSSVETGRPQNEDGLIFSFESNSDTRDMVSMLGLSNVSSMPSNSVFKLNGSTHSSASNHIAINHVLELDFHKTTDAPVRIGIVPDTSQAMEQVDAFIDAYNTLIDMSNSGQTESKIGSRNLAKDISVITSRHSSSLSALGIETDEQGYLVKNEDIVSEKLKDKSFNSLFTENASFMSDLTKAIDRLTIDPIAYVNKLIVTYPNKANKFDTPYTQSMYSGLIYNNYA